MATFITSINQSIDDIVLSCYASSDFTGILMEENEDIFVSGHSTVLEPGTRISYDPLLISDVALQQQLVNAKINTLWKQT